MKLHKYRFNLPLVIALNLLIWTSLAFSQPYEQSESNLVVVNGIAITRNDLDNELNRIKMRAYAQQRPISEAALKQMKQKVLEALINRELLYQESVGKGIQVEMFEVENQIEVIKQRLYSGKSLDDALLEINMTKKDFETQVRKATAINKLLEQMVYQKVSVSDKESKIFYDNNPQFFKKPEQVRASHILIKLDPDADAEMKAEARERIEEILAKIKLGQDFAELAQQYSEGPSRIKGGDLGYFDRKMMVKPFADAAFSLQTGQISEIVETRYGFHIIQTVDRTPASKFAYMQIKDRLIDMLRSEKIKKETITYLDGLKKKADIQRLTQP